MASKPVTLALSAFLDSDQARALEGIPTEDVRTLAGHFLATCYEDLGIEPKQLDGHDVHQALGHVLPGRLKRKDPLAEHAEAVLRAYFSHLHETQVVPNTYDQLSALETTMDEFVETVRTGHNAHHHHHEKQKPVVNAVQKLGRNDPCSCGSGKKYKKCHGKGA